MKDKVTKVTKLLFSIYLIALVWIILFKLSLSFEDLGHMRSINLIPFNESLVLNNKLDFSEIIMNVIIFMPLGIYIGTLCSKWSTGRKIFLLFLVSLLCEVFQYILGVGASDITDIINNTVGGIVGLLIYVGIVKIFKDQLKAQKFINVIAGIGTTLMVVVLAIIVVSNM
ncbi:glycopeptide antibiotics resistance protein [Paenibacillus turicensis]|uniref:Glycopeptide antibiotics resistance protein n=1 Tax=Paenibacillus turicensis TaxID=160487 RepID=A0ABS4FQ13_9BACL|nr:VanZ family protein [Paenibacillus turicensis]MBP1904669.1 glycopeptide antibiotics resistance protein [Paenibacillus turicensis]